MHRARVRLLWSALLAACGDSSGGAETGATTGVSATAATDSGTPTTGDVGPASEQIDRLCALIFSCGCEPAGFASEAACRMSLVQQIESYQGIARQSGLIYDPACFDLGVAQNLELGCRTADEVAQLPKVCVTCEAIRGDKAEGEACGKVVGDFADCGAGLHCQDGACVDPCARLGEGETCADQDGITFSTKCMDGLYCDFNGSRACAPVPGLGEPCLAGMCGADLACDSGDPTMPVCVARGGLGDGCEHGCVAGLVCTNDQCVALGGDGEACPCAADLYCRDGLCGPPSPQGAACAAPEECAFNTQCSGGICEAQVSQFCVPP